MTEAGTGPGAGAGGGSAPRCVRADCGRGVIDDQGYCTRCGRRPLPPAHPVQPPPKAPGAPAPHAAASAQPVEASAQPAVTGRAGADRPVTGARARGDDGTARSGAGRGDFGEPARGQGASTGVASVRPDPWYGLDLAEAGPPPAAVTVPAAPAGPVPEEHRVCGNPACGEPVGRGAGGAPSRVAGFCAACGTPFDFGSPRGLTIADRYDVERYLSAGTYGATYVAHDRNLNTTVVLKKLRPSVAATAERERDVLVGLRHDNIVRILGYEAEGPYLVLEHLDGVALSALPGDRLEHLLAHGLRILQALDYLHARALLHCDVKPVNIVRFTEKTSAWERDRVRLIDFGAVRSLDHSGPVTEYTSRYAPPSDDAEHSRPSAAFDLYGLGVTLGEVCHPLMGDRAVPGIESLRLLLDRAVAGRGRRFSSARQFGEQLSGVIRQIVAAAPTALQVARPSALFGPMSDPLDGGLGAARPLAHWLEATETQAGGLTLPPAFSCPAPGTVAAALPTPLHDSDGTDLRQAARRALAQCRLAVHGGNPVGAAMALAQTGLPRSHWLHSWYSGLIALVRGGSAEASRCFAEVRAALPGELVPQLALGLCAEQDGDLTLALSHYTAVFATTPELGAAGFGSARVLLRSGRRARAVATALRLAEEFPHRREAEIATVRLLAAADPSVTAAAVPGPGDLDRAGAALAGLDLAAPTQAALRAELQYARYLLTGDRMALSETVRGLGPHTRTPSDHRAVIDLANRLRPPLERRGRPRRSGSGSSRFAAAGRRLSS